MLEAQSIDPASFRFTMCWSAARATRRATAVRQDHEQVIRRLDDLEFNMKEILKKLNEMVQSAPIQTVEKVAEVPEVVVQEEFEIAFYKDVDNVEMLCEIQEAAVSYSDGQMSKNDPIQTVEKDVKVPQVLMAGKVDEV